MIINRVAAPFWSSKESAGKVELEIGMGGHVRSLTLTMPPSIGMLTTPGDGSPTTESPRRWSSTTASPPNQLRAREMLPPRSLIARSGCAAG